MTVHFVMIYPDRNGCLFINQSMWGTNAINKMYFFKDGQGDCNSDDECLDGLICFQRTFSETLDGYDFTSASSCGYCNGKISMSIYPS